MTEPTTPGTENTTAAPADAGADDLQIIIGEQQIEIGGEIITVRELTFAQEMRLVPQVQPMLQALREVVASGDLDALEVVFYSQPDLMLKLVATCTGKDPDWLAGLSGAAGHALWMTVWVVNQSFFYAGW